MIIDYSTARPSIAQLKAAGVTAVGRYLGWDGTPGFSSIGKNLTAAEASDLAAAGISIFACFEYAAAAAAKGATQGRADGRLAISQLASLGLQGSNVTVYFAVDYDIPDYAPQLPDTPANAAAKLGPVAAYFRAITQLGGRSYRVGVYGGYYAVRRLLDAGLAVMAWQTVAWSGGQRDPRAVLYQTAGSAPFADADVNIHETAAADFGQWPRPAQQQPDPPTSTEAEMSDGLIVSPKGVRESRTWPAGTAKQIVMFSDWKGLQDTPPVVDLRIGHLHSQTFDAGQRTVDGTDTYTIGSPDDCNGVAFTRIDDGPATVAWHTNP